MKLQVNGTFGRVGLIVRGGAFEEGSPLEFEVILHDHPVVQHGDEGGSGDFALIIHAGRGEEDVVGLPFSRRPTGVDHGRGLLVERTGLAVEVGLVLIAVENLHFVAAHQVDATVAASLPLAHDLGGRGPFEVQLAVTELGLGVDAPLGGGGDALRDLPLVASMPARERLPVEQHGGIGGGATDRAGLDDNGFGPVDATLVLIDQGGGERQGGKSRTQQSGSRRATNQMARGEHLESLDV